MVSLFRTYLGRRVGVIEGKLAAYVGRFIHTFCSCVYKIIFFTKICINYTSNAIHVFFKYFVLIVDKMTIIIARHSKWFLS